MENRIFEKAIGKISYKCPIITIYEKPKDYPDKYVARLWDMNKPTEIVTFAESLDTIRLTVPSWMVKLNRCPDDDPCILETWL